MKPLGAALLLAIVLVFLLLFTLMIHEMALALETMCSSCSSCVRGACSLARTVFSLTALGLLLAFAISLLVLILEARASSFGRN